MFYELELYIYAEFQTCNSRPSGRFWEGVGAYSCCCCCCCDRGKQSQLIVLSLRLKFDKIYFLLFLMLAIKVHEVTVCLCLRCPSVLPISTGVQMIPRQADLPGERWNTPCNKKVRNWGQREGERISRANVL